MATKLSCREIQLERMYEPGFEMHFGITDETTDVKNGCINRNTFPRSGGPAFESRQGTN